MIALTREVTPSIERCELTHLAREPIDYDRARAQHQAYEECLESLGCRIDSIPGDSRYPDSVFIEDTAVVLDEVAILTRPGAESRRGEIDAVDRALRNYREVRRMEAPATLDGGDVLHVGTTLYVGLSTRTNREAVNALQAIAGEFGYDVIGVPFRHCLHLKSAITRIAPESLLINPDWVDSSHFDGFDLVSVDPAEPHAANALLIAEHVVFPSAHLRTHERLDARGLQVRAVEISELAKAEGGVTCCSLIVE